MNRCSKQWTDRSTLILSILEYMGDKATLRLARQELEDLYLGVPDDSVDLTFRDFAFHPAPAAAKTSPAAAAAATTTSNFLPNNTAAIADHVSVDGDADDERKATAGALARSSTTNIFTYRPLEDHEDVAAGGGGGLAAAVGRGGLLQLSPIPASPPTPTARLAHSDDDDEDYADHHHHQYHHHPAAAANAGTTSSSRSGAAGGRPSRRSHVADDAVGGRERHAAYSSNHRRPGIPHSSICALCNNYVYVFRHRCLVRANCKPFIHIVLFMIIFSLRSIADMSIRCAGACTAAGAWAPAWAT
jgi:hypothetical protein